jgi:hypothetical protein
MSSGLAVNLGTFRKVHCGMNVFTSVVKCCSCDKFFQYTFWCMELLQKVVPLFNIDFKKSKMHTQMKVLEHACI